jgi:drug/metabolite transporter (DMT)-like permease
LISSSLDRHARGTAIVALGVLVLSFDALMVRLAGTSAWNVIFWRGLFIVVALASYDGLIQRWAGFNLVRDRLRPSLIAGFLAGVGLVLFPLSIMHTTVANTVVILTTTPFFAALFTRLFLGEPVPRRTWMAIGTVAVGVGWIFAGSLSTGGLIGDVLALCAAAWFGLNMTFLRKHPDIPRIPIVAIGGVVSMALALVPALPFQVPMAGLRFLALSGLVQMPLAMVMISVGTRFLPPAEVTLLLLIETLLGPIWVWRILGEVPGTDTLLGGGLILLTLITHSYATLRQMKRQTLQNA